MKTSDFMLILAHIYIAAGLVLSGSGHGTWEMFWCLGAGLLLLVIGSACKYFKV